LVTGAMPVILRAAVLCQWKMNLTCKEGNGGNNNFHGFLGIQDANETLLK